MRNAISFHAILLMLISVTARGADEIPVSPVDEEGRVVNFGRDIAPLLAEHCLECHGEEQAKNDFRVDDREIFLQYVVPEDPEFSMVYADYILSPDPNMLMPPTTHGGPLSAPEIALVRLWIEEGAVWPEGEVVAASVPVADPQAVPASEEHLEVPEIAPLASRVWAFQGYLHPAAVHFPIALLTIGALFVLVGFKWPHVGNQVPMACLLLGSVSAVIASLMGWSFAAEQGYPGYSAGIEKEINWHRWSGVVVAAVSLVLAGIALVAVNRDSRILTRTWKIGLLAVAFAVGLVGHQGGELTYGEGFYAKAFERLTGVEATELNESFQEKLESGEWKEK